jgi:hypothetical protein
VALPRPRPTEIVGSPAFARLKARLLGTLLNGQDASPEAQEASQEVAL